MKKIIFIVGILGYSHVSFCMEGEHVAELEQVVVEGSRPSLSRQSSGRRSQHNLLVSDERKQIFETLSRGASPKGSPALLRRRPTLGTEALNEIYRRHGQALGVSGISNLREITEFFLEQKQVEGVTDVHKDLSTSSWQVLALLMEESEESDEVEEDESSSNSSEGKPRLTRKVSEKQFQEAVTAHERKTNYLLEMARINADTTESCIIFVRKRDYEAEFEVGLTNVENKKEQLYFTIDLEPQYN